MTTRITSVALVASALLLLTSAAVFAADGNSQNSAVGNWMLNPVKSHFENMTAPRMERLRVSKDDQTGLKWSLTGADPTGKGYHQEYDGPTDGAYHPIQQDDQTPITVAYTRAGPVTNYVVKDANGAIIETGSRSLSPDGRTLTFKGRRKAPQGQSEFTAVFDKR